MSVLPAVEARWGKPSLAFATALCVVGGVTPFVHHGGAFRLDWLGAGSVLFVLLGLCGPTASPVFTWLMRAGLVGCALGDFLGPSNFQLGAIMFLAAHLAFSAAFLAHGIDRQRLLTRLPIVVVASLGLVAAWLWPHIPSHDRTLVVAYTTVISIMAILAGGLNRSPAQSLLWPGAWIFYVSDIFVARWRFVDPSAINGLACYSLYYFACLLLAWGTTRPIFITPASPSE